MNNPFGWICGALIVLLFTSNQVIFAQKNHHCNSDRATSISLVQPWHGTLDVNEAHCFKLLEKMDGQWRLAYIGFYYLTE
jgi:hypothetical protein